ncbi:signal peptidase I [Bacteroidota bacterium]
MSIPQRRYINFGILTLLLTLFTVWIGFYWLFIALPLLFDHFFTRWFPIEKIKSIIKIPRILMEALDWIGAIITALFFVILIRTLFIEAYTIPTPSMEQSLLVGDYLFVSKLSYGPRIPITPLGFPFTHNTMPFSDDKKSYTDKVKWQYKRLAGFGEIKHNDVVVFNFPEGDTVVRELPDQNYYSLIRKYGRRTIHSQYDVISRPVDKHENFVKRCVGLPGDTVEIRHTTVFINSEPDTGVASLQHRYYVRTNGQKIDSAVITDLNLETAQQMYDPKLKSYVFSMTAAQAQQVDSLPNIRSVTRLENTNRQLAYFSHFPYSRDFQWTEDNYGKLTIPKKGATVRLNPKNLPLYKRIIETYEENLLELRDSTIYINNEPRISYTFGMDYFFMLGDNRHNSADSRVWGFVPEDHIVGKAVFIWLSVDRAKEGWDRFRWNRMFKKIK